MAGATSALFVLDIKGRCLICRDYRGNVSAAQVEKFFSKLLEKEGDIGSHGPVCYDNGVSYMFVQHNNVYLMTASRQNSNAASLLVFLHRVVDVFLDVVESVNLLVNSNGQIIRSEVNGALKMRTRLSGMPECKLGLNDRVLLEAQDLSTKGKAIDLDDIKFHQCVRLARFENDRTISFIPPDGSFDLMTYRVSTEVKPPIWVEAQVERYSRSWVEMMVKARSQFKEQSTATSVTIELPVPPDATSPSIRTSVGSAKYAPEKDALLWTIKYFPGNKEYMLRAEFKLPSIVSEDAALDRKAPIHVKFEIPYFTVSGIQVRYLKIIEKSGYQALPWVRYITVAGDYELRLI